MTQGYDYAEKTDYEKVIFLRCRACGRDFENKPCICGSSMGFINVTHLYPAESTEPYKKNKKGST